MHLDANAVLGTERDGGKRFDALARNEAQTETLSNRNEEECGFHHGEARADANARAAAKREVGETGNGGRGAVQPTIRMKAQRIGEPARIAVREPLAEHEIGTGRKEKIGGLERFSGGAPDAPSGWIEAKGLADDAVGVGKLG